MIKAVFNAIVVEPIKADEDTLYGNIIVPDMGKEKNLIGKIVSIGPGYLANTGKFIVTTLQEGDIVLLPQMGPIKIEHDGQEFYACAETMVLGLIK
jgi:co-chaperonin GroES (HSP10)